MDYKQELINEIKKSFNGIDTPVAYANYLTALCTKEYLRLAKEDCMHGND